MKLTYRDKIIAAIILAIAILALGFFALIRPVINNKKENEDKLVVLEKEKAKIEAEIAEIPGLKKDILSTHESTNELTKIFVPVENVENPVVVDKYMQDLAVKSKVKLQSVKVDSASVKEIKYYYFDQDDKYKDARKGADVNGNLQAIEDTIHADRVALKDRPVTKILQTDYAVTAYGTKKNIWDYLEAIKQFDKSITVKSVKLGDYSFGKNDAKKANVEAPDPMDEEERKIDIGGDKTISNATPAQIIITLYSVYEMDTPNVD
ncbi:MAG: hypothetical protein IKW96_04180 [Ruminococcus sp.]|uniref:hypothetical protein n=1 Tax=Ruminococcus sp. TaxID=41978 RepID=UPI0025CBF5B1|nr:hypothetical protein [Ruminococcus sp.]MBR5682468.1 hypothetical protein [Ruminococcus sp.]